MLVRLFIITLLLAVPALAGAEEVGKTLSLTPPDELDLTTQGLRIAGFLLVLIVVAALVNRFGRKLHNHVGSNSGIELLSGRNMGQGVGVRVIRIHKRAWLVGVSKEGINLLAELNEDEVNAVNGADK
ncbi:flagellar biosynthetic protein FliO [Magnetococcus sp. PR-3]|uniref:flagellar biosynthetic protein FliO n=1 Tax=Magnetococcus sp. PR-3 TaxID=3120355 RepID=UPI002FCDE923